MAAEVVGLYTAVEAGTPVESHPVVALEAGIGITGDRYATRRGYWSDPKWPDQELTLIEDETAATLAIDAGLLRRNIVTRGVRLDDLIGARFQIGDTVLEGVRPCDPCAYIEGLVQHPGLLKALVTCGGLRARIVQGGHIHVGDIITMLAPAVKSQSAL